MAQNLIPPRVAMRLRGEKNRRELFGLHGPASVLTNLIRPGCVAVDAGANAGLYSYWMARKAQLVHAFEPQPRTFERLQSSTSGRVSCHQVALSNANGEAFLSVPFEGSGEATLRGSSVAAATQLRIQTRTLDSYQLSNLGFVKIDVEGHEEALLEGALDTLRREHPTVFIEIEERHNPGGITRVADYLEDLGYVGGVFVAGLELPLRAFDVERDQLNLAPESARYGNNFVFRSVKR